MALLLPAGFCVYRMNVLVKWHLSSVYLFRDARRALSVATAADIPAIVKVEATGWGLVLSGVNLLFWTYNLFVTMLLRIVPEFLDENKCESPRMRVVTIPSFEEPEPMAEEIPHEKVKSA